MNRNKASVPDGIVTEILPTLDDFTDLINNNNNATVATHRKTSLNLSS